MALEGDALVIELQATGAKLKLEPWDGDIFTARLMPLGKFAPVVENLGPLPNGFRPVSNEQGREAQFAPPLL